MKKLILSLSALLSFNSFSFIGPGFGGGSWRPDPDHDPRYQQDGHHGNGFAVKECSFSDSSSKITLNKKFLTFDDAKNLISKTQVGVDLLKQFEQKDVSISLLTDAGRVQLGSSRASAVFNFTGKEAKVYIDPSFELGVLSITLFHEMVHSVDPLAYDAFFQETAKVNEHKVIWKKLMKEEMLRQGREDLLYILDKTSYSDSEDQELYQIEATLPQESLDLLQKSQNEYQVLQSNLNYRIERKAYDQQNAFLAQLKETIPCFEAYVQEHRRINGFKIQWKTSDEFIFRQYPNIKKEYLNFN